MNLFESIFENSTLELKGFLISILVALISGVIFAYMCLFKGKSSKSFLVTLSLLPALVAMVIMLVNGNIGAGIAVAGAFSLVRFRSAQGSAKEICSIFVAMASGLAFGMGYLAYGVIFIIVAGGLIMLYTGVKILEPSSKKEDKILKITIPENLDYNTVFDDLLDIYTVKHSLVRVKSTNLGSMFQLTYEITLKDLLLEKSFIDELRCRNGNLEIMLERVNFGNQDL